MKQTEQFQGDVIEGVTETKIRNPSISIDGRQVTVRGLTIGGPYSQGDVGKEYLRIQNWVTTKDAEWGFNKTLANWKRQLVRAKQKSSVTTGRKAGKDAKISPSDRTIRASLDRIAAMADRYEVEASPAKKDATQRLRAPKPHWGKIEWQLPPSYTEFISLHSQLWMKWGESSGHDEFVVFTPKEIREAGPIVYLEADVCRSPGRYLSTNHLVPFASAGDDECVFCFDVTNPSSDGEYPVYFHHQDEPRARYKADGSWEDPASAKPDFPSFGAWLAWVADQLAAGKTPPNSTPSAYRDMPGRKGRKR